MGHLIRRATADDADFIAWTILAAQRGHRPRGFFDFALNLPEAECLAFLRQLTIAPVMSQWHHSCFWIAEQDGVAAAALCALPVEQARITVRPAVEGTAHAAGLSADDISAIWQRSAYARSCWTWGRDGDWMLEHVATKPAYRGRGLMNALLRHSLGEGRALGFARASIAFYIGNDAAESAYKRVGFHFAEEKRDATFEALTGAGGFRRFERAIADSPEDQSRALTRPA